MPFERDARALRRLLRAHSVEGYPVDVPILGTATVLKQPAVGGWISYVVEPETPMPFDRFADRLNMSAQQMDLRGWKDKYERAGRTLSAMLPIDIMERLEAGGTASERDREFGFLIQQKCIDVEQRVICYAFPYERTVIPVKKLKKGMLVDFSDGTREGYGTTRGWAGRIVGFEDQRGIVLLELFSPTPSMRAPEGTVWEKVRPGFYSSLIGMLGKGLAEAFEEQRRPLPHGKWSEDGFEYLLDEPLSIDEVDRFCKQFYPDQPYCFNQAMLMYVIPIPANLGQFHPLPEAMVDLESVIMPEWEGTEKVEIEEEEPEEDEE